MYWSVGLHELLVDADETKHDLARAEIRHLEANSALSEWVTLAG